MIQGSGHKEDSSSYRIQEPIVLKFHWLEIKNNKGYCMSTLSGNSCHCVSHWPQLTGRSLSGTLAAATVEENWVLMGLMLVNKLLQTRSGTDHCAQNPWASTTPRPSLPWNKEVQLYPVPGRKTKPAWVAEGVGAGRFPLFLFLNQEQGFLEA